MTPSYPTATRTRSQGMVFLFSSDPVTRSKRTPPVDVWSNHACQVAFFPSSALLDLVSVNTRSSPASSKCTPRQPEEHVNQQAASLVGSSRSVPMVLLSLDFGQGMHPTYLDKARVRAVGPSCSQRATSREFRDTVGKTCRTTQKAKAKASDPTRGE